MNGDNGSGPVDEQLLSRSVVLPKRNVSIPVPALVQVQLAEAAVAVAAALLLAILVPEQLKGNEAVGLHLAVNFREVQTRTWHGRWIIRPGWKQQFIQPPVVMIFGQRPGEAGRTGLFSDTGARSPD